MELHLILQRDNGTLQKNDLSINSWVTHCTLRLSQFYVICFAVFKVQFVVPLMVVITTNATLKTKILLYLAFYILSNFDGIINSIIFFYMNGEGRSYLKAVTLDKLNRALPRKHIKSKNLWRLSPVLLYALTRVLRENLDWHLEAQTWMEE